MMLDRKTIEMLGGWDGYRLERVVWPEEGARTVSLYLKPKGAYSRSQLFAQGSAQDRSAININV